MGALALAAVLAGCGGAAPDHAGDGPAPDRASVGSGDLSVSRSGWRTDFTRHSVPLDEFVRGGPGKDGIPAIDRPRFAPVERTGFLAAREPVIELVLGGEARAYPLQILVWHEIVNDEVADTPVAVTFCPLCNTALVFDRRVRGRTLDFGVSGLLRSSDLVMYDRQTESWWQQFGGDGIVGRYAGAELRAVPARIVAWRDFARRHPRGKVLARPLAPPGGSSPGQLTSRRGGFLRPYGQNPYAGYDDVSSSPLFAAANAGDDRLSPKERVVFVERGGESVAIPLSTLARRRTLRLEVGGRELEFRYRGEVASALDDAAVSRGRSVGSVEVREDGKLVAFDQPFWFAVAAFRPDVRVVR